jgi:hypothetical protein
LALKLQKGIDEQTKLSTKLLAEVQTVIKRNKETESKHLAKMAVYQASDDKIKNQLVCDRLYTLLHTITATQEARIKLRVARAFFKFKQVRNPLNPRIAMLVFENKLLNLTRFSQS